MIGMKKMVSKNTKNFWLNKTTILFDLFFLFMSISIWWIRSPETFLTCWECNIEIYVLDIVILLGIMVMWLATLYFQNSRFDWERYAGKD